MALGRASSTCHTQGGMSAQAGRQVVYHGLTAHFTCTRGMLSIQCSLYRNSAAVQQATQPMPVVVSGSMDAMVVTAQPVFKCAV